MSKKESAVNVRTPKRYGWLPDLPDYRDFPYRKVAPRAPALSSAVSLSPDCSVENQGYLGNCTANMLVGATVADLSRLFAKKPTHAGYTAARMPQIAN